MVNLVEPQSSDVLLITLRQLKNEISQVTRCPPDQRDRFIASRWPTDLFSDAIEFDSMADGFLTLSDRLLPRIAGRDRLIDLRKATASLLGVYQVLNQMLRKPPTKARGRTDDTEVVMRTVNDVRDQAGDFLTALLAALWDAIPGSTDAWPPAEQSDHFKLIAYVNRIGARRTTEERLDNLVDQAKLTGSKEHADSTRKLSKHFEEYGRKEYTVADRLRNASVLSLLFSAVATYLTAFHLPSPTIAAEVAKLTAVVPLTLLAVYTARESSRHRDASSWAVHLAVQLETFGTYTAGLSDTERLLIQTQFANRIFGPPPTRASGDADAATVTDRLAGVLRRRNGAAPGDALA
jgi:hypothetical protein